MDKLREGIHKVSWVILTTLRISHLTLQTVERAPNSNYSKLPSSLTALLPLLPKMSQSLSGSLYNLRRGGTDLGLGTDDCDWSSRGSSLTNDTRVEYVLLTISSTDFCCSWNAVTGTDLQPMVLFLDKEACRNRVRHAFVKIVVIWTRR